MAPVPVVWWILNHNSPTPPKPSMPQHGKPQRHCAERKTTSWKRQDCKKSDLQIPELRAELFAKGDRHYLDWDGSSATVCLSKCRPHQRRENFFIAAKHGIWEIWMLKKTQHLNAVSFWGFYKYCTHFYWWTPECILTVAMSGFWNNVLYIHFRKPELSWQQVSCLHGERVSPQHHHKQSSMVPVEYGVPTRSKEEEWVPA